MKHEIVQFDGKKRLKKSRKNLINIRSDSLKPLSQPSATLNQIIESLIIIESCQNCGKHEISRETKREITFDDSRKKSEKPT